MELKSNAAIQRNYHEECDWLEGVLGGATSNTPESCLCGMNRDMSFPEFRVSCRDFRDCYQGQTMMGVPHRMLYRDKSRGFHVRAQQRGVLTRVREVSGVNN